MSRCGAAGATRNLLKEGATRTLAADLFLRRILGIRAPDIGPVIFRYGYVFSLGLTLLPIPVMIFGSIMRFVLGVGAAS